MSGDARGLTARPARRGPARRRALAACVVDRRQQVAASAAASAGPRYGAAGAGAWRGGRPRRMSVGRRWRPAIGRLAAPRGTRPGAGELVQVVAPRAPPRASAGRGPGDVRRCRSRRSTQPRTVLGQRPGGRAGPRVGRERGGDQRQQRRGDASEFGLPLRARGRRSSGSRPAVRRPAGGGEGHGGAPGVHVGRPAARLALDDLGREVAGGAHHHAGLGEPGGVGDMRDAEVDHDRLAVVEHHVARLEVAVHYPGAWMAASACGQPAGQPLERQAAAAGRLRAPRRPACGPARTWSRCTATGPVTSASRTSATYRLRTRRIVSTSRASRRRAFGSAATAGPRTLTATAGGSPVAGEVDHAHAAFADLLEQAVGPDLAREGIQCRHRPLRVRCPRQDSRKRVDCARGLQLSKRLRGVAPSTSRRSASAAWALCSACCDKGAGQRGRPLLQRDRLPGQHHAADLAADLGGRAGRS